jgi:LysR family glycine cleavage system transcriptional activator
MRRLPSLNALRAFEAAARHRSFTLAAEELSVSHAAISRHVRGLEEALGLRLFRRDGRGVVPTEDGGHLADAAGEAFARIEAVVAELTGEPERGLLRLSVEPAFANRWLVPRLAAFQALHPLVEISIDPTTALADMRHDPIDLGIRYGRGGWSGVIAEELIAVKAYPVCAPDLAARLATPADLAGVVLLHEDTTRHWTDWLAAAGVEDAVDGTRGPRLSDTALALDAAARGHGVALGDDVTCLEELEAGWLVKPFATEIEADSYWLAMPEDRRLSAAAGTFRGWLLDAMERFAAHAAALAQAGRPA